MSESYVSILVGGIAASIDFIPSIVYAALYGCALFSFLWGISNRKSRTWLTTRTGVVIVERIIMFSLRAAVSHTPGTESDGLSEYFQWTIATSPIMLCEDLSFILRSLVVHALGDISTSTINNDTSNLHSVASPSPTDEPSLSIGASQELQKEESATESVIEKSRKQYRMVHNIYEGWLVTSFTLGVVGNALFVFQREKKSQSVMNHALRYTSGVMTSIAILFLAVCCILSNRTIPRLNQTAVYFILIQSLLLVGGLANVFSPRQAWRLLFNYHSQSIPSLYRLWALSHTTTADLLLTTAAPLNSRRDKVVFYVINILPEFFVALSVVCVNAKEFFGVGSYGDQKPSKWCFWKKTKTQDTS